MNPKALFRSGSMLAAVVASGLLLSACQKTAQPAVEPIVPENAMEQTSVPAAGVITATNSAFDPAIITVAAGSTVTFTNLDAAGHSVTSDDGTSFNTDMVSKDQTVTFVAPTTPGTYTFHCMAHPMMTGTIIVQ
jgi:plastocyanin